MTAAADARRLSVVVAAWNDPLLLATCLDSLEDARAQARADVEIIVASAGDAARAAVVARHPGVVHVGVEDLPTVPQLRAAGLARASGDVVAFIEDHARVAPTWASALLKAHADDGRDAVGGPVAQAAGLSKLDWGAYLLDYGRFFPTGLDAEVDELSGINMSLSRSVIARMERALRDGVFEPVVHAELRRMGIRPFLSAGAVVYHGKHYSLRPALLGVYYLGRGYAGRRVAKSGVAERVARAASSVLLPAVITWRVLGAVLPRGIERRRLLGGTGFLLLLALSWSAGECSGYLAGAGDSDARWR